MMYILVSETRGVEYASKKKSNCIKELERLKKDDEDNGGWDDYYIDTDDSDFYKEGRQ